MIGSNFITQWGSFVFFGPFTIHPDYWGVGAARSCMEKTMEYIYNLNQMQFALITFPESPKHLTMYGKFGFHPKSLIVSFQKHISEDLLPSIKETITDTNNIYFLRKNIENFDILQDKFKEFTKSMVKGLDVNSECEGLLTHNLGSIVYITDQENRKDITGHDKLCNVYL